MNQRFHEPKPTHVVRCTAALGILFFASSASYASHSPSVATLCGGPVEKRVWQLWDSSASNFLRTTMVQDRLIGQGDSYALYDIQGYAQNLAAMALRCKRTERLSDLAGIVTLAYNRLEPMPGTTAGRGWICHGGRVCNDRNRLIGTEVRLNSLQFLAFAVGIANGLARAETNSPTDEAYVDRTVQIALEHIDRWTVGTDPSRTIERLKATPETVRDGQSRLFLTDADLWTLTIYSELAGILDLKPALARAYLDDSLRLRIRNNWSALAKLLRARTTLQSKQSTVIGNVTTADLDRGFWRLYADSRYAGYTGTEKPVSCGKAGQREQKPSLAPQSVPVVADIGWDFSHARRFIHVFNAMTLDESSVTRVFGIDSNDLTDVDLPRQFAATLVTTVWNADLNRPLFANYWSGANGWYRVAYDNGTVNCFEGYGPFGLSDSFTTGGFAAWRRYYGVIGEIADRIYALADSDSTEDRAFIQQYYPGLAPSASANNRMLTQLMFWPSLISETNPP